MKIFGLALLLGLLLPALLLAENGQYYFRFEIDSPKDLQELTKVISIDNVQGKTVWAYANEAEWERFQALGYQYEILPDPGSLIT
ncbi:MAG: zinc carboxypeptidase, partial [bacterium]